jgi:hypothetical protein
VPSVADDPIVFSAALPVSRETVYFLARLLHQRRQEMGTRRGTRALGPFKQAVLVLRWFLDATRVAQLAVDNRISLSTAYTRLHEGIDVLAALAPHAHEALAAARAAGVTHVNLDGTLIGTDRVARTGPNGADLWWSGKHKRHGGNIQVLSYPDGFPAWVSDVRPGREHDSTCAKAAAGLLPALEVFEGEHRIPTLSDLGYQNLSAAIRHPHKKPKNGELTERQDAYNKIIRGVRAAGERANALLKETFTALRKVSLDPWRIGAIAKAALVLLHLEHHRPLPGGYTT